MGETASRSLLFAVVAAASPVALLATLAALTIRRGQSNGMMLHRPEGLERMGEIVSLPARETRG